MNEKKEFEIPDKLTPRIEDYGYDLEEKLASVVNIKTKIPEDAFTASVLGTDRAGHGVLIQNDGLVVTIGYLIAEAKEVWITAGNGQTVPGHVVGYDYDSGFGLVQALGKLNLPISDFANFKLEASQKNLVLAGCGGISRSINVSNFERKEFAGYWEYVLDDAIYTSPAHPDWGGAALFDDEGNIAGIGSLFVENFSEKYPNHQANLCVPTELLTPILSEICKYGQKITTARPWLGFFVSLVDGEYLVLGAYQNGPAYKAGIKAGDTIELVADKSPADLADFFRSIWAIGPAGAAIEFSVRRGSNRFKVEVKSTDRMSLWKSPELH